MSHLPEDTVYTCAQCGEALTGETTFDPRPQTQMPGEPWKPSYMHLACATLAKEIYEAQGALARKERRRADERLREASPALLSVLQGVVAILTGSETEGTIDEEERNLLERARNVIARATS